MVIGGEIPWSRSCKALQAFVRTLAFTLSGRGSHCSVQIEEWYALTVILEDLFFFLQY